MSWSDGLQRFSSVLRPPRAGIGSGRQMVESSTASSDTGVDWTGEAALAGRTRAKGRSRFSECARIWLASAIGRYRVRFAAAFRSADTPLSPPARVLPVWICSGLFGRLWRPSRPEANDGSATGHDDRRDVGRPYHSLAALLCNLRLRAGWSASTLANAAGLQRKSVRARHLRRANPLHARSDRRCRLPCLHAAGRAL